MRPAIGWVVALKCEDGSNMYATVEGDWSTRDHRAVYARRENAVTMLGAAGGSKHLRIIRLVRPWRATSTIGLTTLANADCVPGVAATLTFRNSPA